MTRKSSLRLPLLMGLLTLLSLAFAILFTTTSSSAAPQGAAPLQVDITSPNVDGTEPLPAGTSIETLLPGMHLPIAMTFDSTGRLFYVEKDGGVRLFSGGVLQPTPVLAITVDSSGEQGLLGITLDPDFSSNHYVYVYYTCLAGSNGCPTKENRVARFVETGGVGSGLTTIFSSPNSTSSTNHNGGNIHFGPDGKLYVTIGEDANTALAQSVTAKNGKIHRMNADGSTPSDNPVFTQTGALPTLFTIGMRNSFDFDFDPYTPMNPYPRIFASENGPACDDEVNRIEGGYNYGWRSSYPCDDPNPSPTYNTIPPLWFLGNGACCEAPVGTLVYDGSQIPQWQGGVFMATNSTGRLRHYYMNPDRTLVLTTNVVSGVTANMDLEVGPDGAFYYMEGGGYTNGTLKRIVGPGGGATPTATNVPPSSTPTHTTIPVNTSTSTATRTNTAVPTSTRTSTNTATRTVTATTPPTQTPGGPTATNTPTSSVTSTSTTVPPTLTSTVEPTGTNTAVPPTSTVLPTATACTLAFADVPPDSTFYEYIQCLACKGVIGGYPCGSEGEPCNSNNDPYFRPGNNISRGQIAKIVSNAASFNDDIPLTTQTYQDVAPGSTFWVYIERLSLYQIMQGYACGGPGEPCGLDNKPYFRPANNATRGQIAKIVSNSAGFNDDIQPGTQSFEDVQEGSTFHVFVERLLLNRPGVINGYPCGGLGEPCVAPGNRPYFRPSATATRGQLSKIVSLTFHPDCTDTVNVLIQEFAFIPSDVTVQAGTTVRFINRDLDYHTATADDSSFNTDRIYQNQFVDIVFSTPGSFGYYCQPHPYMRGTVNVIAPKK